MDFVAVVDQVIALLRQRGRVAYRTLKVQFSLDDEALAALKDELLYAQQLARDEDDRILVWTGDAQTPPSPPLPSSPHASPPATPAAALPQTRAPAAAPSTPEAERRQLTVLFCDLADSTRLARQLDPEDLREVIRVYQATCVEVIQRFGGYVAQYLGDGLLVYFGYPQAHEDDAQRAVRTGLGMLAAMETLHTRLVQDKGVRLAVRVSIHTGLVVVGEMGSGGRYEHLALGDTPNLAARLQGLAAPNTMVISEATSRLVHGYFTCQDLGAHALKGFETPVHVSQVLGESAAQSRLEAAEATGLTPLVGREAEVTLLRERWTQSQAGLGQVVLLSGEAGIGKSRLVRVLTERVAAEGAPHLTLRCSPYHTTSAFYPVITHLQRLLQWHRDASPAARLATLEQVLRTAGLPLAEVVPLLAALLAVPIPERYPALSLSPQRQKQKTQEALVAWLLAETVCQPVLAVWEDLQWADPSTLELLERLLDQVPTARLLLVLTARPEFHPPWAPRSVVTPLTLTRLTHPQSEAMVLRMTGGKPLPAAVLAQVLSKTDGIPLFVEELVKTILEAELLRENAGRYVLTGPLPPLAIPATLQDALMARLDRLAPVKDVAQFGAVLGREFAYELLRAVVPQDEATVQQALTQLVDAELLYQRGLPPQATYRFKHALIQDTAYQSLLKSTRQHAHQRIAQVLATDFPAIADTQPELLAHHYTEAGLRERAIGYWQQAGQRAIARSAHVEALTHLTKGMELLAALPATPAHTQQALTLHLALGTALTAIRGYGAPEVERTYTRARALCQQGGESPQLIPVLFGLWRCSIARRDYQTARAVAEQCLALAQRGPDAAALLRARTTLGVTLFYRGEFLPARTHLEQGRALVAPPRRRAHAFVQDPLVACCTYAAQTLWFLGYPDQAQRQSQEALTLAQELAHPFSLAFAHAFAAALHQFGRDWQAAQAWAEAAITLSTAQEFPVWWAMGTLVRGWALATQGQGDEGVAQLRQGLDAMRATEGEVGQSWYLAMLVETYGKVGRTEDGLAVLAEVLAAARHSGERVYEAELHRLQGELLLQSAVPSLEAGVPRLQTICHAPAVEAAAACFHEALAIARRQQAKAWELRAALSLSRLWQQQGKRAAAHELLAPIYGWFTEGFDTADLREAHALLDELGG